MEHSAAHSRIVSRLGMFALGVGLLLALSLLAPSLAVAAENQLVVKDGAYQCYRGGKLVTQKWQTIDGARYYFDERGCAVQGSKKIDGAYYIFSDKGKLLRPAKSKVYTLKSGVYYVSPKGTPAGTGWCIVGGKLYRVGTSGKCATSKTVEGISLAKDGAARNNTAAQLKMAVMKKLSELTKPGMTKRQKLRACFNYCLTRKFVPSTLPKDVGAEGWAQRCALAALKTGKTQCYGFSCSFAAFAYELGYSPVIRESRNVHAWVMIGGKAYDNMGPRFGGKPQRFAGVKSWKFASWGATSPKSERSSEKKSSKVGLVRQEAGCVFYQKGKKLKNAWKTVGGARYYFGKDGVAATGPAKIKGKWYVFSSKGTLLTGKKTRVVGVAGQKYQVTKTGRAKAGWNSSKTALYLENGRKATGLSVHKGKLYWFSKSGTYGQEQTRKIRAAAREEVDAAELLALIGTPQKTRVSPSCHALTAVYDGGEDAVYFYRNATLSFFRAPDGAMFYLGCE